MTDRLLRSAEELVPGDRYVQSVYDLATEEQVDVVVLILREREPWEDFFGREMFRYWATRLDTGDEGWVTFGPGAVVRMVACDWQTAYGLPWDETCGKPAEPGRPWCAEHCQDWRDNYPHLPLPEAAITC